MKPALRSYKWRTLDPRFQKSSKVWLQWHCGLCATCWQRQPLVWIVWEAESDVSGEPASRLCSRIHRPQRMRKLYSFATQTIFTRGFKWKQKLHMLVVFSDEFLSVCGFQQPNLHPGFGHASRTHETHRIAFPFSKGQLSKHSKLQYLVEARICRNDVSMCLVLAEVRQGPPSPPEE